jgi:hypothetical protein
MNISILKSRVQIFMVSMENQYRFMYRSYNDSHVLCVQCLLAMSGGTWTGYFLSLGGFVIIASSKRGLVLLTCCSVINTCLWCSACIYNASQQSIRVIYDIISAFVGV